MQIRIVLLSLIFSGSVLGQRISGKQSVIELERNEGITDSQILKSYIKVPYKRDINLNSWDFVKLKKIIRKRQAETPSSGQLSNENNESDTTEDNLSTYNNVWEQPEDNYDNGSNSETESSSASNSGEKREDPQEPTQSNDKDTSTLESTIKYPQNTDSNKSGESNGKTKVDDSRETPDKTNKPKSHTRIRPHERSPTIKYFKKPWNYFKSLMNYFEIRLIAYDLIMWNSMKYIFMSPVNMFINICKMINDIYNYIFESIL